MPHNWKVDTQNKTNRWSFCVVCGVERFPAAGTDYIYYPGQGKLTTMAEPLCILEQWEAWLAHALEQVNGAA